MFFLQNGIENICVNGMKYTWEQAIKLVMKCNMICMMFTYHGILENSLYHLHQCGIDVLCTHNKTTLFRRSFYPVLGIYHTLLLSLDPLF